MTTTKKPRTRRADVMLTKTKRPPEVGGRYKQVWDGHEVCHQWAANQYPEGRAGNIRFYNGAIYSYGNHFPMARHVELADGSHVVFFTTKTYSVSTARHLSYTRDAIPGRLEVFHVTDVMADTRAEHEANMADFRGRIATLFEQAEKARTRGPMLRGEAVALARNANRYAEAVGLADRLTEPSEDSIAALRAEIAEARRRAEESRKRREQKANKERRERAEKEQKEREDRRAAWLRGEDVSYPYYFFRDASPTGGFHELRVKKTTGGRPSVLETSGGARVPFDAARPLLDIVRGAELAPGMMVAEFQVDGIDRENRILTVGCHRFRFDEVERIAAELGLQHEPGGVTPVRFAGVIVTQHATRTYGGRMAQTERKTIAVDVWVDHPQKPGYTIRKGGRPIGEVFDELDANLEDYGRRTETGHEYVSVALPFKDRPNTQWPDGETLVLIRHGGNEGWSIELHVEQPVYDEHKRRTGVHHVYMGRVKVLLGREDALKMHNHVWNLFT